MTSVERAAKVVERDRVKVVEHDRKRAEKEAEEEAQHAVKAAAKAAKRDEKWTVEVDASIESMIKESVSFLKIASKLGNGLKEHDIKNRWYNHLKESSGITRPPVQPGCPSRITWSVEVDASIESMIKESVFFSKIASKLGNGLKKHDIKNRWYNHLKESSGITKPPVQPGCPSRITWTADVDATIVRMRADDISFAKIASELGNGLNTNDIKNRWYKNLKDK